MSSLVRNLALAAVAGIALSASAGAQLLGVQALPPVALPPVGLPPATGNLPVGGPLLQNILAQPEFELNLALTDESVDIVVPEFDRVTKTLERALAIADAA